MQANIRSLLRSLTVAAAFAPAALAFQAPPTAGNPDIVTPYVQDVAGKAQLGAFVRITAQPGDVFNVIATPQYQTGFQSANRARVAKGTIGQTGSTVASWQIERPPLGPSSYSIVVVLDGVAGKRITTPVEMWAELADAGTDVPVVLNFNTSPVGPLLRGEPISMQYLSMGVQVGAVNNNVLHPNMPIVFDSAKPTGGDFDLATPGYGPGNMNALGNLLIIAENAIDVAPADGYIDNPDDEAAGGVVTFRLAKSPVLTSIILVDIDDLNPSYLVLRHSNMNPPTTIPVPNLGDNSVQQLFFKENDVDQVEVYFGGSGAIGQITFTDDDPKP
jgi:hypothetical protein